MPAIHSSCRKGTRVLVVKRDGTKIRGRFHESNDRYCLLRGMDRIPWNKVRSFIPGRRGGQVHG